MTSRPHPANGLLLASAALFAFAGAAEASEPTAAAEDPQNRPTALEGVTVTGERQDATSVQTLTTAVEDTPQVVNVIDQTLLRQQNVTTLEQALRNVPGITLSIGEGGGGMNGDQFRIRGLDAKDDIYIDGLRDFGVYTRDSFNYEQIEVLKGPSGATLGRGTTGGAINTTSKSPRLRAFTGVTAGVGSADFLRGTIDWNRPLGETSAMRINLMGTSSETAERDLVEGRRWGVAPSLAIGLGTPTQIRLGFLHQRGEGRPDYGVPVVTPPGQLGRPVTEFGVDRANFYGYESDLDDTTANVLTLKIDHVASDWLSLASSFRLGWYDRDFGASAGSCSATALAVGAPAGTIFCNTAFFDNDPTTIPLVGVGSFNGYIQESGGFQSLSTALITRPLMGRRNELLIGLDVSMQDNRRDIYNFAGVQGVGFRPPLNLFNPNNDFTNVRQATPASARISDGKDYAVFASNQFWLTNALSLVTGVRVQRYEADFTTITYSPAGVVPTRFETDSNLVNPKASLIWQPSMDATAYVSWARAATPIGTSIASAPLTIGSAALAELEPEVNQTFEAGGKVTLFEGLLFQGSAFQIEKSNAKESDGLGNVTSSGDAQQVRGVELALNGTITPAWTLFANYTWLDAEITDSATAANIGNVVQFVPEHAASFWTSYTRGPLTVGGGVTWQDEMFLNPANSAVVPETVSLDALVAYDVGQVHIAVNGYNLTDELNYTQVFASRVVPSAGRTFVLTLSTTF